MWEGCSKRGLGSVGWLGGGSIGWVLVDPTGEPHSECVGALSLKFSRLEISSIFLVAVNNRLRV